MPKHLILRGWSILEKGYELQPGTTYLIKFLDSKGISWGTGIWTKTEETDYFPYCWKTNPPWNGDLDNLREVVEVYPLPNLDSDELFDSPTLPKLPV